MRFRQPGRACRKNGKVSCRRRRRPTERFRYKIYVGAGNVSRENDASKDGNVVVFHIRMRVFATRRLSSVRVEFFAVGKQKNEQSALNGAVLERALTAAYRFVPVRKWNAGG